MRTYKDYQYIKSYESSYLSEQKNEKGVVISATETKLKHYRVNLANKQGMKNMKAKKLFNIHDELIKSNTDAKLFTYMITNQSKKTKVTVTGSNGVSVKFLAQKFEVTERKVQKFISEAIELDMLKRIGKEIYLNPYLVQPFGSNNHILHQLQVWWDSEPVEEITFISESDLKEDVISNTSKILGEMK